MFFGSSGARKSSQLSSGMLGNRTTIKAFLDLITSSVYYLNKSIVPSWAGWIQLCVCFCLLKPSEEIWFPVTSAKLICVQWRRTKMIHSSQWCTWWCAYFQSKALNQGSLCRCDTDTLLHRSCQGLAHSVLVSACVNCTEKRSQNASKPKELLQLFIHFCFPLLSRTGLVGNQASYTILNHVLKKDIFKEHMHSLVMHARKNLRCKKQQEFAFSWEGKYIHIEA